MSASGSDGHSPRKRTDIHETHRPSPPRKQPSCHQRRRLHGLPDSAELSGSGSPRNQKAEQVFADWTDGPLAHLPSGSFPANGAWLACAAISHNLLRAAGSLAGLACARARGATLRRDLIDVAARTARRGRGEITLHLPAGWHREQDWMSLFEAACGLPATAA
jgi:hypothetical protein